MLKSMTQLVKIIKLQKPFLKKNKKKDISKQDVNPRKNLYQLDDLRKHIEEIIPRIPESNGSKILKSMDVNLGIICDESMYLNYKEYANIHYLTPTNYKEILDVIEIRALIIMSTWSGINNVWQGCAKKENSTAACLKLITKCCKEKNIPIIFQSFEHPAHFKKFLWIAKLSDIILTTVPKNVKKFQTHCKHKNVYVSQPAADPLRYNPIGNINEPTFENIIPFSQVVNNKRAIKFKDMSRIFKGILSSGKQLFIINKNAVNPNYEVEYSKDYYPYIIDKLNERDLIRIRKLSRWALVINALTNRYTCAREIYELQASGNLLLSNINTSVLDQFPNIFTIKESKSVKAVFKNLSSIEKKILKNAGIRNIMLEHTYHSRLSQILSLTHVEVTTQTLPKVAIILENNSLTLQEMFHKQSYHDKSLYIETIPRDDYKNFDIICFFGKDHDYGVFYLEDMISAFVYTDCDFITKSVYQVNHLFSNQLVCEGKEHQFTEHFTDKYRTIFWRDSYRYEELFLPLKNHNSEKLAKNKLKSGYSSDTINYCYKPIPQQYRSQNYKFTIVIPVYNNYKHLLRALISLKMETYFHDIEILIIDDGSTDQITPHVVREYCQLYSNISCYLYADGGSGSASRPRNKGVELSTADYVTFLDPDNAGTGKYSYLFDEIIHNKKLDFVFGHIFAITKNVVRFYKQPKTIEITDPRSYFINNNFPSYSVQSAMYKRSFLIENDIQNPIGAIGQDTVFAYETFLKAKCVKYVDKPIHFYYFRRDSVTKTINANFFKKSLATENHTKAIFKAHGLYDLFLKNQHANFIEKWYFDKLSRVSISNHLIKKYLKEILLIHEGIDSYLSIQGKETYNLIFNTD